MLKFRGVHVLFQNFRGGLECCSQFKEGVHVRLRIFRGVRVLRPSAANLRDPPLWVNLTRSLNKGHSFLIPGCVLFSVLNNTVYRGLNNGFLPLIECISGSEIDVIIPGIMVVLRTLLPSADPVAVPVKFN